MGLARQLLERVALIEKSDQSVVTELTTAYNHLVAAAKVLKPGSAFYKKLEEVDAVLKDNVKTIAGDCDALAADLSLSIADYQDGSNV